MLKIMSMKAVCEATSLAKASVYRKINPKVPEHYDETFPKPFPLSERKMTKKGHLQAWSRLGFLEAEVDKWIAARSKKRTP